MGVADITEFFTGLIGQHRDVVFCAVQIIDYRETRNWGTLPHDSLVTGLFHKELDRFRDVRLHFRFNILQRFQVLN
mgnify:CR=1 FL=1